MDLKRTLNKLEQELIWKAIWLTDELYVCRLYGKGNLTEDRLRLGLAWVEFKIEIIRGFKQMFYGK